MKTPSLTRDDVAALVGDVGDAVISAILEIDPTAAELDEALAWLAGEDDVMGETERPLTGKAAEIFDILAATEDYGDDR